MPMPSRRIHRAIHPHPCRTPGFLPAAIVSVRFFGMGSNQRGEGRGSASLAKAVGRERHSSDVVLRAAGSRPETSMRAKGERQ